MFRKKFMQILQSLVLFDKAKKNQLTEEEWQKIEAAFKEQYGKSMAELQEESIQAEELRADREAALAIINETEGSTDDDDNGDDNTNDDAETQEKPKVNNLRTGVTGLATALKNERKKNADMVVQINSMSTQAVPDVPVETIKSRLSVHGKVVGATDKHLFGIEHEMFSMEDRWNRITFNKSTALLSDPTKQDFQAFQDQTYKYGASIAQRYRFLKENKMLEMVKSGKTFTNDLSELPNAGLGDQYVTLRQDALISRILEIPTPYDLFPRRYGVQDRELMTIAYFEELSQAYQKGHVFKGGMKLQPEMAYVDDAMFKTEFGPMKEIERQYIGYLNTDGSDPMKWSMIEWQLLNMYKVLVNEQNTRVIRGCYVKPETGVAGSFLNAGTGLIYTLQRYYHENKLLPHSDEAYNEYSEVNMLDAAGAFINDVIEVLDEDESLDDKFIYFNKRHQHWWIQNIRAKFGKDTDFTGPNSYLNVVPDYGVRIKWVPNLGNLKLMFIQMHGNLQSVEFIPGEMLAVDFDRSMELMHVWSTWKEGFSAFIVGKAFNSLAELKENKYSMQEIFMNRPATLVAPGATTVNANSNYWFVTGTNAAATTITDIENAKKGVVYIIETGDTANASKIAKSGKFDAISADWTPTAVGDYIMVVLNKDNKFMELERRVGGSRTINTDAQPNIIGGRK